MEILSSKFMVRFIALCLLLSTFPVIVLGVFAYSNASGTVREKVDRSNMGLLLQTEMNVERALKTIDSTVVQVVNSDTMTLSLSSRFEPKDFQLIDDVSKMLTGLQSFELGILDVHLVNFRYNWAMSNSGIKRYYETGEANPYLAYYNMMPKISGSLWVRGEELGDNQACGKSSACLILKLPLHSPYPIGLVMVEVPVSEIGKLISGNNPSGELIVLDKEQHPISTSDKLFNHQDSFLNEVSGRIRLTESPSGRVDVERNKAKTGVVYRKSDYNGWTYLYAVSIGQLTEETAKIGWLTFYLCALILLAALIITYFGSSKIYSPIRTIFFNVIGEQGNRSVGAMTDEFEVISQGIQDLKQTKLRLLSKIEGNSRLLDQYFIQRLIHGELKRSDIAERTELIERISPWKQFCVIVLQIDTLENTRYEERDTDLLLFAVNNIVSDLIPSRTRLQPIVFARSQITLVGDSRGDFLSEVCLMAERVQQKVNELLDLKVSLCLSRGFGDIMHASEAYKESLEALNYRIRLGFETIISIGETLPDHRLHITYPDWLEKEIATAIKAADAVQARQALERFLDEVFKETLTHHQYQFVMNRLLIDLLREIDSSGEILHSLFGVAKPLSLGEMKSVGEVGDWFVRNVIQPAVDSFTARQSTHSKEISSQVLQMIHSEYDTELTLEGCSARLNYHASYVKAVFRRDTQVNFSEYLSQYRLMIAKRWLASTDMKVSDIAARLRYNNTQNFIRFFRKMEGVTPGQYRLRNASVNC